RRFHFACLKDQLLIRVMSTRDGTLHADLSSQAHHTPCPRHWSTYRRRTTQTPAARPTMPTSMRIVGSQISRLALAVAAIWKYSLILGATPMLLGRSRSQLSELRNRSK